MLARTDQPYAPWNLIEANSKRYARVTVIDGPAASGGAASGFG
jgi:polyphosphate kinase 2 (PPK2 family)